MFKRGQGRPSRPNGTRPKGTGEWPQPRNAARLPEREGEEREREAKREQEKREKREKREAVAPQRHTTHTPNTHTTHTPRGKATIKYSIVDVAVTSSGRFMLSGRCGGP